MGVSENTVYPQSRQLIGIIMTNQGMEWGTLCSKLDRTSGNLKIMGKHHLPSGNLT
jgi:hypothetical protein